MPARTIRTTLIIHPWILDEACTGILLLCDCAELWVAFAAWQIQWFYPLRIQGKKTLQVPSPRRHFCYHKPLGSNSLGALLFFFPEAEACWTLRKLRRSERRRERNDLSLRPPPARAPPFPPFDQRFWPWDAHDFHGMAIMAVAISRNTRRYQKAAA